jgi:predicted acetyltransferase
LNIIIEKILENKKHVLANLIELYAHDFSEITPNPDKFEVDEDGRFGYDHLDGYWSDPNNFAYIIKAGDHIAGFVLIKNYSVIEQKEGTFSMAEFFILRKYRKKNIGKTGAEAAIRLHKGKWEVPAIDSYDIGKLFWEKILRGLVGNNFTTTFLKNSDWNGMVYSFTLEN